MTQSGQPRIAVWIEDPSQVMILIGWDSVEAPTQHRGTPTHNATREGTAVIEPKKHRRALPLSGLQPQPRGGIVCD